MATVFKKITASEQTVATTSPATLGGLRVIGTTAARYISVRTGGDEGTVLLSSKIPDGVAGTSRLPSFEILPPGILLDCPEGIHVYITSDDIGGGSYPTVVTDCEALVRYTVRQA